MCDMPQGCVALSAKGRKGFVIEIVCGGCGDGGSREGIWG